MTQIFDNDGEVRPVTLVEAGPATVIQVKTAKHDGYNAVQLGYGSKNPKNIKNPQKGHLLKAQSSKLKAESLRWLREFRIDKPEDFKSGDIIDAGVFKEGDKVKVSAVSKGKGFQGAVKRHGFSGGPRTHGQKHSEREPGSIGATWPQRVIKGKRMPGRMGAENVSVKNLEILKVEPEKNLLFISGAIPGRRGALVEIVKQ